MIIQFNEQFALPIDEVFSYFRTPADWVRLYGKAGEVKDPKKFIDLLKLGLKDEEEKVMTLAEHWKQQGIEKGIERGDEQATKRTALNLLKNGFSVEQTADLTELSIEATKELRTQSFS